MKRIAALFLLLAGCASDRAGADIFDQGSWGSDMGAAAGDLSSCSTQVSVSPSSGVVPQTLIARADVVTTSTPSWTVSTPSGFVTPSVLDASGLRVSIAADEPGTYIFHVEFLEHTPCPGEASVVLTPPAAAAQAYRVRLTPPGSTGLPQQDQLFSIVGSTPLTAQSFVLGTGTLVGGVLRGPGGAPIAGEVLLAPEQGPELHVAVPTSGSFALPVQLGSTYRVVLIPRDAQLAPRALGPLDGVALQSAAFTVGAGAPVSGLVRDGAQSPLMQAAIALRQGALPSGLGQSLADGSYGLRAEPGTYALAASAAGWPDLSLSGLDVAAGGASVDITYAVSRLAVSLRVVHSDGSTPVVGARVTLRSSAIAGAASITTAGGPRSADGVAQAQGLTAADGTLALPLPAATYDVLVEPAEPSTPRTGLRLAITAAGEVLVALVPRPQLAGVVRDGGGAPVPGARVRARSRGGVVFETLTGADGGYALSVDAGLGLEVSFLPPAGASLSSAQAVVGGLDGALGVVLPARLDAVLPTGLLVAGAVLGPSGTPIGGVAVDVLCASCGDPRPLAHAESASSGAYQLYLPDPGGVVFDGGTD